MMSSALRLWRCIGVTWPLREIIIFSAYSIPRPLLRSLKSPLRTVNRKSPISSNLFEPKSVMSQPKPRSRIIVACADRIRSGGQSAKGGSTYPSLRKKASASSIILLILEHYMQNLTFFVWRRVDAKTFYHAKYVSAFGFRNWFKTLNNVSEQKNYIKY